MRLRDERFTGLSTSRWPKTYLWVIKQNAAIEVSESETEAAADTIGVMLSSNGKQTGYPKPTFHADHPFVYLIQEASSGAIFFIDHGDGSTDHRPHVF